MEGIQSKKLIIVLVCLAAAVAVTLIFNNPFSGRGDEGKARKSLQMLCVNEKCEHTFEISTKDFQDAMGPMPMMPLAQPSIQCLKCGEKSAFVASKCKKCSNVFMPDYTQDDPEKCPECGYSEYEEEFGEG